MYNYLLGVIEIEIPAEFVLLSFCVSRSIISFVQKSRGALAPSAPTYLHSWSLSLTMVLNASAQPYTQAWI